MGNSHCCSEQKEDHNIQPTHPDDINKLQQINKTYEKLDHVDIQTFHSRIVTKIIKKNTHRREIKIPVQEFSTQISQDLIYELLKHDLAAHGDDAFNLLIRAYFKFLCKIMLNEKQALSYEQYEVKISINQQDQEQSTIAAENYDSQFEEELASNSVLVNGLFQQISIMMGLLNQYLMIQYGILFRMVFNTNDINAIRNRDILLIRITQQSLLSKGPLVGLLPMLLKLYYRDKSEIIDLNSPPKLPSTLIPKYKTSQTRIDPHKDSQSIIKLNESKPVDNPDIPYYQTFPIVREILDTNKPWVKFVLIEELDKLIHDLYLRKRTSSIEQARDIISAQDAKEEILDHILYYILSTERQQRDYKLALLQFRHMQDEDAILSSYLKYTYSPIFQSFVGNYKLSYKRSQVI